MFELHPQLAKDCFIVGDLELCQVLLMNDCQYPWLILVPKKAGLSEILQLGEAEQRVLLKEINAVNTVLQQVFAPDKLNMAALGNMVPQLHIHCIARFTQDVAWPKPVWGVVEAKPYDEGLLNERLALLKQPLAAFGLH